MTNLEIARLAIDGICHRIDAEEKRQTQQQAQGKPAKIATARLARYWKQYDELTAIIIGLENQ